MTIIFPAKLYKVDTHVPSVRVDTFKKQSEIAALCFTLQVKFSSGASGIFITAELPLTA